MYAVKYFAKRSEDMIRKVTEADRHSYIEMVKSFYNSEAVCHEIPISHIEAAFNEMMRSDVYMEGFMLELNRETAGYANIAKTFSCEGGGLTVWIEELFILPQFRCKGLGRELFAFLEQHYGSSLARMRLEVTDENERAAKLYRALGFEPLEYRQLVKEFR